MLGALRNYFGGRLRELRAAQLASAADREAAAVALVREALRLVITILEEQVGKHHYELSVFADVKEPRILAYADSASIDRPRSDKKRRDNPQYYREKGYQVVELLDYPRSDIQIISDTHQDTSGYKLTPQQQMKIGSTILYCFDTERPSALVATCNVRNTFVPGQAVLLDLIRAAGLAIRAELELEAKLCVLPAVVPGQPPAASSIVSISSISSPSAGPGPARDGWAFSWIHLSDIHFGAGIPTHRYSLDQVARAVVADIERHAPKVNAVFVTGDIAFKAAPAEYAQAAAWLAKVAGAARLDRDAFFLVPGNHDIDRGAAGEDTVAALHEAARLQPSKLDGYLSTPKTVDNLIAKLAAYSAFVREHFPGHPEGRGYVDWHTVKKCQADACELCVRIVGMSTVWLSDKRDGKRDEGDNVFVPNLAISRHQLDAALGDAARDELVLLLTHHPAEWLELESQKLLGNYLAARPHIHLCGHVHRKATRFERQLGKPGAAVRFLAGATHDEAHALAEHTYSWGAIRRRGANWQVGWAPRVYLPERDEMRADHLRHDLEGDGFAWLPLP